MQNEIKKLIKAIKTDYIKFATRNGTVPLEGYFADSVAKFDDGIEIVEGRKYTKIIRENGVWGFIVNTDKDAKFLKGDILKAAGWNAPARNKARGNVFADAYSVAWTGPHYLN
jgi:hypothetical protein